MRILVINSGSSSVKFALFHDQETVALVSGAINSIGTEAIEGSYRLADGSKVSIACPPCGNHTAALDAALKSLRSDARLDGLQVDAIGHRVVHGGPHFSAPVLVDDTVIQAIRELAPLAPVHSIPNANGIEATGRLFPGIPQVVVFDTAFHQSIPPEVYRYAIPREFYEKYRIRRYGFHGTSHAYVSQEAIQRLKLDPENSRILSAHLGNGCSATAIRDGRSVDTSMGLTPLEGLVMGTRSGNVDPNLHRYLAKEAGLTIDEITEILNRKSGLSGLSGISNDLRVLTKQYQAGDPDATLAVEVFCFRLARELAALTVALQGMPEALIFTGGIGENSALVRKLTLQHLTAYGFEMDADRNTLAGSDSGGIVTSSSSSGPIAIVIPTNEEYAIARATAALCRP